QRVPLGDHDLGTIRRTAWKVLVIDGATGRTAPNGSRLLAHAAGHLGLAYAGSAVVQAPSTAQCLYCTHIAPHRPHTSQRSRSSAPAPPASHGPPLGGAASRLGASSLTAGAASPRPTCSTRNPAGTSGWSASEITTTSAIAVRPARAATASVSPQGCSTI